jgi:arsenate reductase
MNAMAAPPRVLFVCIQNAGRSQIASALFEARGGETRSAGTRPSDRIHPNVSRGLAERGFDVSSVRPRKLTLDDAAWADVVVTMGCGDECPVTGKPTEDWPLPDPKDMAPAELAELILEIEARVGELATRLGLHAARA